MYYFNCIKIIIIIIVIIIIIIIIIVIIIITIIIIIPTTRLKLYSLGNLNRLDNRFSSKSNTVPRAL